MCDLKKQVNELKKQVEVLDNLLLEKTNLLMETKRMEVSDTFRVVFNDGSYQAIVVVTNSPIKFGEFISKIAYMDGEYPYNKEDFISHFKDSNRVYSVSDDTNDKCPTINLIRNMFLNSWEE